MTDAAPIPRLDLEKVDFRLMTFAGIATVVLGALSLAAPLLTGVAISMLVGILVLTAGIGQCTFAFKAGSWGRGLLAFLLGALTMICGGLMIAHPLLNLGFLTLLLAGYFIAEGVFEIVYAFQVRPANGWGVLLFSGVVSIVLGWMIWRQWPVSGAWAVGLLVGIKLLFSGFAMISVAGAARRALAA